MAGVDLSGITSAPPVDVALLAALPSEVRPFLRRRGARRLGPAFLPWWLFSLGQVQGLLALTGMGGDAAARKVHFLCDRWHPKILISCGFGGAITPQLSPGDLVLGESLYSYDPSTHHLTPIPLDNLLPAYGLRLTAHLLKAGLPIFTGALVSTPTIIYKARHRSFLAHLSNPVLDLETAAVGRVAVERGLPLLSLRGITDGADEEIPEFIAQATVTGHPPGLRQALGWLAADPCRFLTLLRLWRRAACAAYRLSQALEIVIPLVLQPGSAPHLGLCGAKGAGDI